MSRMNREHDLLVQERAMAAAKDAAVIAFLQKVTQQNPNSTNAIQIPVQLQLPENPLPPPPPVPAAPPSISVSIPPQPTPPTPIPPTAAPPAPAPATRNADSSPKTGNGTQNYIQPASSSRWPKAEVQALIRLRTNLDVKYQENGPKGPLWEEISAGMRKLGYNRNAKRCKEKWENINKYFKKVKESNKKRPEDAKTCPYFHQLDALYKEKASFAHVKPETALTAPIMATPEQQWPIQQQNHEQQQQQQQQDTAMEDRDHESDNMDENDHEDEDDGDDDEEEDEGGGYELVTSKQPTPVATTVE